MKLALRIFLILALLTWELIPAARVFAAESESVILKVTVVDSSPQGTIVINNGADYAASTAVTLTLYAWDTESSVEEMQFSNDNITWSAPEGYATTKSWVLTDGYGGKTVYAKFKDAAGNWSGAFSDTIILTDIAITTFDYTYDDLNRLETVTFYESRTTYAYDEVGNIVTKTTEPNSP